MIPTFGEAHCRCQQHVKAIADRVPGVQWQSEPAAFPEKGVPGVWWHRPSHANTTGATAEKKTQSRSCRYPRGYQAFDLGMKPTA